MPWTPLAIKLLQVPVPLQSVQVAQSVVEA
jgi:hypothetical protein